MIIEPSTPRIAVIVCDAENNHDGTMTYVFNTKFNEKEIKNAIRNRMNRCWWIKLYQIEVYPIRPILRKWKIKFIVPNGYNLPNGWNKKIILNDDNEINQYVTLTRDEKANAKNRYYTGYKDLDDKLAKLYVSQMKLEINPSMKTVEGKTFSDIIEEQNQLLLLGAKRKKINL